MRKKLIKDKESSNRSDPQTPGLISTHATYVHLTALIPWTLLAFQIGSEGDSHIQQPFPSKGPLRFRNPKSSSKHKEHSLQMASAKLAPLPGLLA